MQVVLIGANSLWWWENALWETNAYHEKEMGEMESKWPWVECRHGRGQANQSGCITKGKLCRLRRWFTSLIDHWMYIITLWMEHIRSISVTRSLMSNSRTGRVDNRWQFFEDFAHYEPVDTLPHFSLWSASTGRKVHAAVALGSSSELINAMRIIWDACSSYQRLRPSSGRP